MKKDYKILKQFDVVFSSLSLGSHTFSFDLKKEFFDFFDYTELQNPEVKAEMGLEKKGNMLILKFIISGKALMPCDRCSDLIDVYFNEEIEHSLYIKFGLEYFDDGDESLTLPENEYKFNVSNHIYEYAILSLPSQRAHSNIDDCNAEVIKILEQKNDKKTEVDPRWEALKKLK